jgi:deoxycytidylate deaminase
MPCFADHSQVGGGKVSGGKTDEAPYGPELIFAVVAPVGTSTMEFFDKLAGDLLAYGYRTEFIKLSDVLAENAAERNDPVPTSPEDVRIRGLIAEGDRYCEEVGQRSAVALEGVAEIRALRVAHHQTFPTKDSGEQPENRVLQRTAYILDSIKRHAEIIHLRQLYGDHLIVVGLRADTDQRIEALRTKLTPQYGGFTVSKIREIAKELIDQDLTESTEFGQNTLKAFPLSDVFIDVDTGVGEQVTRLTDLLFGSPNFPTPSVPEYGMHLAQIASTRSPELGLKVGAAVVREDGTVLSLGANVHPSKSDHSPEYDASALDIRDLVIDALHSLGPDVLQPHAQESLSQDPDRYVMALLEAQLKTSKVASLIEFQPTVHAEMDALLCLIRDGRSVAGATMYVTAYPCHNCAKHLIALNIPVKYLEPYPKSRAEAMYGDDVRGSFDPFTGIAPRRYQQLFDISEDRKSPDGSRKPWGASEKRNARPKVDPFVDDLGITGREAVAVRDLKTSADSISDTPEPP